MSTALAKPNLDEQRYLAEMEHGSFLLGSLLDLLAKSKCLLGVRQTDDRNLVFAIHPSGQSFVVVTDTLETVLETLEDEITNNKERRNA